MSLVLNVEILGEFKQLTAATKGAQSSLSALNKRTKAISSSMNKAFAAIGIGFSLRIITQELEDATKAAIDDAKSMGILALAMENTGKATKDQVAQAEKAINKMQYQAGIADDKLRPAYQKLFIATKDVTASNRLLQIALDASAATGKDLDVVSQAMAKSLAGSDTALLKLIPSLKGAKDPIDAMGKAFDGAASEAADLDPYMRMQRLFEDMQEQIGMVLIPLLQEFSTWLATPEGQKKLGQIVDLIKDVVGNFAIMAKWVLDNKDWLVPMVAAIGTVTTAWKLATDAVKLFQATAALGMLGPFGIGAGLGLGEVALAAPIIEKLDKNAAKNPPNYFGGTTLPKGATTTIVQNIKATQSASQIAATTQKFAKTSGTQILRGGR